jgi:hypothetical protein
VKKRNIVIVSVSVCILLICLFIGIKSRNTDENVVMVPITIDVYGVNNSFKLAGSIIGYIDLGDRSCYDPRTCAVDYTGSVVAGQFNENFNIPVETTWHLNFIADGKFGAHNITIGGTTMKNACILGDSKTYFTWGAVSFIINRDGTVTENPNCTAVPVIAKLIRSGDSQRWFYDDKPFLPYDGVSEGPMELQSSMTNRITPQNMTTFVPGTGWVEDFYMFATAVTDPIFQNGWFSIYQDAIRRSAVPPIYTDEPGVGGLYLNIYDATGTVALCTTPANTELVHWHDVDIRPGKEIYAAMVERIDPVSGCPLQQADNRMSIY